MKECNGCNSENVKIESYNYHCLDCDLEWPIMKDNKEMTKKRRVAYMLIGMAIFAGSFALFAEIPVDEEFAKMLIEQFEAQIAGIDATGIALHNLTIALAMFIPGIGMALGTFVGIETGVAMSAMKMLNPVLEGFPSIALLLITPFGLMELTAYGLAMSRSVLLVNGLRDRAKLKLMLKPLVIEIGIVVALLLIAGQIEQVMIEMVEAGEMDLMEGFR